MNKSKGDCMVDYMNVRPSTVGDLHGPKIINPLSPIFPSSVYSLSTRTMAQWSRTPNQQPYWPTALASAENYYTITQNGIFREWELCNQ